MSPPVLAVVQLANALQACLCPEAMVLCELLSFWQLSSSSSELSPAAVAHPRHASYSLVYQAEAAGSRGASSSCLTAAAECNQLCLANNIHANRIPITKRCRPPVWLRELFVYIVPDILSCIESTCIKETAGQTELSGHHALQTYQTFCGLH